MRAEFGPKFSNSMGRFIDEDEEMVIAEIGCAPPISQPLREFIRCLMNTVPHGFVTVDMRGLTAALVACARERRVTVSVVVRDAVARALPSAQAALEASRMPIDTDASSGTVKVSIRLTTDEVRRLDAGAKAAGLGRAAFLSGLIEGVNVLSSGGRRDHLAALISSSSELSTLSRNIRHLADLLRRSESRAAQEYRSMLDTLASDVNRHLDLAGNVMIRMQPATPRAAASGRTSLRSGERN
jgi:hypothetical protein